MSKIYFFLATLISINLLHRVLRELEEDHDLTCNTVKDKTRLNHKTAGKTIFFPVCTCI